MMLIRFGTSSDDVRLGLVHDDHVFDLSETGDPKLASLKALLTSDLDVQQLGDELAEVAQKQRPLFEAGRFLASGEQTIDGSTWYLLPPIDHQEVWAAGVTYKRSEEARKAESEGAALFYGLVYEASRPELFFKATPHRVVGPFQPVGIRQDALWNVPEPELGIVLTRSLQVLGYTVGNDMSSRDIEGENPLYLPQAKVYSNSCAIGPGIMLAQTVQNVEALPITLSIDRDGANVFHGETSTAQMKRSNADLVSYLGRSNAFPSGVVLLTGTGIVPDDSFSLQEGDTVTISIDGVGTLVNPVVRVG